VALTAVQSCLLARLVDGGEPRDVVWVSVGRDAVNGVTSDPVEFRQFERQRPEGVLIGRHEVTGDPLSHNTFLPSRRCTGCIGRRRMESALRSVGQVLRGQLRTVGSAMATVHDPGVRAGRTSTPANLSDAGRRAGYGSPVHQTFVSMESRSINPSGPGRRSSATALVKLLALRPGHRLHREHAIDLLWPEGDTVANRGSPQTIC
jgi:hypothetical protein